MAKNHFQLQDLRSVNRLTTDAIVGLTDLVEAMHHNIARGPLPMGKAGGERTGGITGVVYGSVRGVTRLVGRGLDALLGALPLPPAAAASSPEREAVLAALNGVLGDYLAASGNPLAIAMSLRRDGRPLEPNRDALAAALPVPGGKPLVLVHGLCMNDLQWQREGHDHGAALAHELGYTPVYLHYNSGLHVSVNGRALAELLERLVANWPVPIASLTLVGHSMGGLLARSAWHYGNAAGQRWLRELKQLVFLGTPHHGAPLERGGNWIDIILEGSRYTMPFARLGKIRSAGITDLRYGYLVDEDWQGRDRFERPGPAPHPLPLPEGVRCYAMAATMGSEAGDLKDRVLGDGLVPLPSALGQSDEAGRALSFPPSRQWIGCNMNHLDLLSRPEVYQQMRVWLDAA